MSLVHTFTVDDGGFQRELHTDSLPLVVGQQVVWIYRRMRPYSPLRDVAAEVVQVSQQRIRIKVCTASCTAKYFWVNWKNVRPRAPGEPAELYPE